MYWIAPINYVYPCRCGHTFWEQQEDAVPPCTRFAAFDGQWRGPCSSRSWCHLSCRGSTMAARVQHLPVYQVSCLTDWQTLIGSESGSPGDLRCQSTSPRYAAPPQSSLVVGAWADHGARVPLPPWHGTHLPVDWSALRLRGRPTAMTSLCDDLGTCWPSHATFNNRWPCRRRCGQLVIHIAAAVPALAKVWAFLMFLGLKTLHMTFF